MTESIQSVSFLIFLIGVLVATALIVKALLDRTRVPALIGFMALGFALRLADDHWNILSDRADFTFEVLAELGIIVLLFRVGLESDLQALRRQLRSASVIWIGNVALSGGLGYLVMIHLLGFAQIPSLIAAIALTATSIGVSLAMWQQHEALGTRKGQLLTDVAEMDDLSGVALMVLLFAILPVLRETDGTGSGNGDIFRALLGTGGLFFVNFVLFAGLCIVFARYGEERLTTAFKRFASQPELMVFVAGIAILIAGVAAWLEFSAALGALFAGLAFSRDPEAVNIDAGFSGVYHLLAPFFFIGIGLAVEIDALGAALWIGVVLTLVAIVGKVLGAAIPSLLTTGSAGATLIGV
ncbi:cation:proton antiporter, partial [Saliniramus sp.]|uniref:cation:proton antiporter n=1 Tax=Saliniramus sp. TaxID=2986772 RepID=UPI002B9957FD